MCDGVHYQRTFRNLAPVLKALNDAATSMGDQLESLGIYPSDRTDTSDGEALIQELFLVFRRLNRMRQANGAGAILRTEGYQDVAEIGQRILEQVVALPIVGKPALLPSGPQIGPEQLSLFRDPEDWFLSAA